MIYWFYETNKINYLTPVKICVMDCWNLINFCQSCTFYALEMVIDSID